MAVCGLAAIDLFLMTMEAGSRFSSFQVYCIL
jgi:hypothetical protein